MRTDLNPTEYNISITAQSSRASSSSSIHRGINRGTPVLKAPGHCQETISFTQNPQYIFEASPTMASTHQAAIIPQNGTGPLAVVQRETPTPGPNEILVEVHAVALNPVDCYQRDMGMFIEEYPAVVGSDVSGIVAKTGSSVTLQPGTRVTAFASAFLTKEIRTTAHCRDTYSFRGGGYRSPGVILFH
jgi:NADPH:quinone reductase and related Zn-dependent oxidoreductases